MNFDYFQTKNVEESLDKLLNKFMKLNLDPNTDAENVQHTTKNLLDVKNVFKSFLIKFAIKQAEEWYFFYHITIQLYNIF